jgi:hypothetical protein
MEEVPENGKESSHSAHANGMNEWNIFYFQLDVIYYQKNSNPVKQLNSNPVKQLNSFVNKESFS